MKEKEMTIKDFDTSKAKNRKRIRQEQKKCQIELKNFPNSSNVEKLISTCYSLVDENDDSSEYISYDILRTLRTLNLVTDGKKPTEMVKRLTPNKDELIVEKEFSLVFTVIYHLLLLPA